jgi:hypothetical protein
MKLIRKATFALAIAAAAITGMSLPQAAHAYASGSGSSGGNRTQELRIQTRLTGGAVNGVTPSGSARFRSRGTSSNFSVEVEDVNLPDGTKLNVTLTRGAVVTQAGSLTLTARIGEIDVNTNDGDLVPQAASGDIVIVSDAAGTALLTGVLK